MAPVQRFVLVEKLLTGDQGTNGEADEDGGRELGGKESGKEGGKDE